MTVLEEPRLMRKVFPGTSKEEHEKNALALAKRGVEAKNAYHEALDAAIKQYGDLAPGEGAISAIYNRRFPEDVKENLRRLSRYHMFDAASRAHWKAAGRRSDAGRYDLLNPTFVERTRRRTEVRGTGEGGMIGFPSVPAMAPGTTRG